MKKNDVHVRVRINFELGDVLKTILTKLNITHQEFLEIKINEFIIENIGLIVDDKSDVK